MIIDLFVLKTKHKIPDVNQRKQGLEFSYNTFSLLYPYLNSQKCSSYKPVKHVDISCLYYLCSVVILLKQRGHDSNCNDVTRPGGGAAGGLEELSARPYKL